uniref:Uncharacterized protein n=1 Tax=Rhizophora mucronata TaxID=61149 RepID=A0A2P2QFN6_RHIMU
MFYVQFIVPGTLN